MGVRFTIGRLAKVLSVVLLVILVAGLVLYLVYVRIPDPHGDYEQNPLKPGTPTNVVTPRASLMQRTLLQDAARESANVIAVAEGRHDKQILFGDTHVHTTWSLDAFMFSLPILNASRGAYPPAAACDYARFVSQLDFSSLPIMRKATPPSVG